MAARGGSVSFLHISSDNSTTTAPTTQADRIPKRLPDNLDGVSELLRGRGDFKTWDFRVRQALKNVGLQDLINKDLARPQLTHEDYTIWHAVSINIQTWLVNQLSKDVLEKFMASNDPKDYADDAFVTIRRLVLGHGHTLCQTAFNDLIWKKRSDFSTVSQYVNDFKQAYTLAKQLDCPLTPYCGLLLLLKQLESDLPTWTATVELQLPNDAAKTLKESEFFDYCRDAIEKGDKLDQANSAASAVKSKSSSNSDSTKKSNKDWKKATFPKKGVSVEEHLEKMLNQKPSMINDRCAYCKSTKHHCHKCWYLVPDLRPDGWTPWIHDIWFYEPKKESKSTKSGTPAKATPTTQKQVVELPAESHVALDADSDTDDDNHIINFGGMAIEGPPCMPSRWIYDTGSSQHLTPDRASLTDFHELKPQEYYTYGTSQGTLAKAKAVGYTTVFLESNGNFTRLNIKAYYQPDLPYGLMSADRLREDFNIYGTNKDHTLRLMKNDEIVGHMQVSKKVSFIRIADPGIGMAAVDPLLLHRRYGHAGFRRVDSTARSHQIEVEHRDDIHCEACQLGKAKRLVSRDPIPRTNDPTELWHADVQKVTPVGYGGYNYFLIMVNNATRLVRVALLKRKSEASEELIRMNTEHKNTVDRYVAAWHLDGGREFNRFADWATHEERGIRVIISPPRTPEANGLSERYGGLINQMSRVMMLDSGLPGRLWPYAVRLAAQIMNRLVPPGSNVKHTPAYRYRSFYNLPNPEASLDFLRVFGCRSYVHIPTEDRTTSRKMEPRAAVGYFVGFDGDNGHVYHVWMPESDKVKRSRDVSFHEGRTYKDDHEDPDGVVPGVIPNGPLPESGGSVRLDDAFLRQGTSDNSTADVDADIVQDANVITGRVQTISTSAEPSDHKPVRSIENPAEYETESVKFAAQDHRIADTPAPEDIQAVRRSQRTTKGKSPTWLGHEQLASVGQDTTIPRLKHHEVVIPMTYTEAIKSPLGPYWKQAMDNQIDKIEAMGTYDIVERPQGARVIPGKWVFDLKIDTEGFVTQFRARWVVCGNRQVPGRDYDQSYAPVASEVAIKMFLTTVAIKNLTWEQCDIISAYLHAQIKGRQVFMKQPTGYHEGPDDQVCELKQALYGLRQAAFLWHHTFDDKLQEVGFVALLEDPCIYRKDDIYLAIYVDDSIIAGPRQASLDDIKHHLNQAFGLKELGEPKVFLGCNIQRNYNEGSISLSQPAYAEESLIAAGMKNCANLASPMTPSYRKADRSKMTSEGVDTTEYQSLTGRLNWLALKTRPDLQQSTFRLQRRMNSPTTTDFKALKSVFRYIQGTKGLGIILASDHTKGIEVYVDAAHADHEDGKSTEGYVIFFAGGPISWSSKKQSIVAPSSTVAEYRAYDAAAKEALYVKKLAEAFGLMISENGKIPIFSDAANSLKILNHGIFTRSTRWLDNRYLFVADLIKKDIIKMLHVPGNSNPADGFTKPLESEAFGAFRTLLGMTACSAIA